MSKEILQPQDKYVLRLPDGMRDRIKAAAKANSRSMNAEIVSMIEQALDPEIQAIIQGETAFNGIAGGLLTVFNSNVAEIKDELVRLSEENRLMREELSAMYRQHFEREARDS